MYCKISHSGSSRAYILFSPPTIHTHEKAAKLLLAEDIIIIIVTFLLTQNTTAHETKK
jgi:hypothetical protein